jgi:hypothetical protein
MSIVYVHYRQVEEPMKPKPTVIRLGLEGWTAANKKLVFKTLESYRAWEKERRMMEKRENRSNGSKAEKKGTTISSLQMPEELAARLRADSLEKKVTLKSIIRKALEDYLNAH